MQILRVGPLLISIDTEHPITIFCPRTLLSYRSMDAPALMEFLEFRRRAEMDELMIEQGAGSIRLADDMLESYWDMDMEEMAMKLPFLAQHDEILQQIIRTQPAYHATHSDNSDHFTPNSIFTEDIESFKETVTASTALHPSPEPEPDTWLSTLSCKTYGLEMEKKKALILLSKHVHQTPGTHARHKSLPNLGTKSTARPCKNILCAREKAYSAVLKIGKAGPRPILRSHSYSRPIISVEK